MLDQILIDYHDFADITEIFSVCVTHEGSMDTLVLGGILSETR